MTDNPRFTIRAHNGSEAHADDPEGAMMAGRNLWDEALGSPGRPSVMFFDQSMTLLFIATSRKEMETR